MTKKETKVVEKNNRRSKDRYETRYKGSMKKPSDENVAKLKSVLNLK